MYWQSGPFTRYKHVHLHVKKRLTAKNDYLFSLKHNQQFGICLLHEKFCHIGQGESGTEIKNVESLKKSQESFEWSYSVYHVDECPYGGLSKGIWWTWAFLMHIFLQYKTVNSWKEMLSETLPPWVKL